MTHNFRGVRRRLAIAITAGALAAGTAVLISTQAASAGRAPHSTTVTVDHFLCYQARQSGGIKQNPNTLLENALQPSAWAPTFTTSGYWHCNPANKSIPGAVFGSKHPLAHLFCLDITYPYTSVTVKLVNQFGKATMTVLKPTQLCLPTWKSNVAPPNMPTNQPPGLDHFTCYPLKAIASNYGFNTANVKAEDEFSAPTYQSLKLGIADRLCVPTTKIAAGIKYPTQGANDPSLVCFPTSPTKIWPAVFDQNQFGSAKVAPFTSLEQFCAPSTMTINPAAG